MGLSPWASVSVSADSSSFSASSARHRAWAINSVRAFFSRTLIQEYRQSLSDLSVSASIVAINQFVAQFFASGLEHGSVTAIGNAVMFLQIPIGIFTTSVATVTFPKMSRTSSHGQHRRATSHRFLWNTVTSDSLGFRPPIPSVSFRQGDPHAACALASSKRLSQSMQNERSGTLASEDHLNLLSSSDLRRLAVEAGMQCVRVASVTLIGWPSNLLLIARRPA